MLLATEIEIIEKKNAEENEKWLHAERISMEQWQKVQEKKKILLQERLETEAKIIVVSYILPIILNIIIP